MSEQQKQDQQQDHQQDQHQQQTSGQSDQQSQQDHLPDDGVEYWKGEAKKAIASRDEMKRKAHEMDMELSGYRTKEQLRQQQDQERQQKAKQDELAQNGKYTEALTMAERRHAEELNGFKSRANQRLVPMAIKSAASKIKSITPEVIDDLPYLLRDRIVIDAETFEPMVVGADGKPLVNEKLQAVGIEEFVTKFVQSRPYMLTDGMPATHGMKSTTKPTQFTIEQAMADAKIYEEWEKADPDGLRKAEAEYLNPASVARRERIRAEKRRYGGK